MYAGAFLYGITQGMSYEEAGKLASTAASKVVTSYGPRLKTEELKALLTVQGTPKNKLFWFKSLTVDS